MRRQVRSNSKSQGWRINLARFLKTLAIIMSLLGVAILTNVFYKQYKFSQRNERLVEQALKQKHNQQTSKSNDNTINVFEAKYGVPKAVLEIPKIKLKIGLYKERASKVENDEILANAAEVLQHTDWVDGGIGKHSSIAAHSGLFIDELFDQINQLKKKDRFYIHVNGEVHTYQVDQIKTVWPHNVNDLARQSGKDYITLITCTPKVRNDHRLLVRGRRIDSQMPRKQVNQHDNGIDFRLIAAVLGLVALILIVIIKKRRKKAYGQH